MTSMAVTQRMSTTLSLTQQRVKQIYCLVTTCFCCCASRPSSDAKVAPLPSERGQRNPRSERSGPESLLRSVGLTSDQLEAAGISLESDIPAEFRLPNIVGLCSWTDSDMEAVIAHVLDSEPMLVEDLDSSSSGEEASMSAESTGTELLRRQLICVVQALYNHKAPDEMDWDQKYEVYYRFLRIADKRGLRLALRKNDVAVLRKFFHQGLESSDFIVSRALVLTEQVFSLSHSLNRIAKETRRLEIRTEARHQQRVHGQRGAIVLPKAGVSMSSTVTELEVVGGPKTAAEAASPEHKVSGKSGRRKSKEKRLVAAIDPNLCLDVTEKCSVGGLTQALMAHPGLVSKLHFLRLEKLGVQGLSRLLLCRVFSEQDQEKIQGVLDTLVRQDPASLKRGLAPEIYSAPELMIFSNDTALQLLKEEQLSGKLGPLSELAQLSYRGLTISLHNSTNPFLLCDKKHAVVAVLGIMLQFRFEQATGESLSTVISSDDSLSEMQNSLWQLSSPHGLGLREASLLVDLLQVDNDAFLEFRACLKDQSLMDAELRESLALSEDSYPIMGLKQLALATTDTPAVLSEFAVQYDDLIGTLLPMGFFIASTEGSQSFDAWLRIALSCGQRDRQLHHRALSESMSYIPEMRDLFLNGRSVDWNLAEKVSIDLVTHFEFKFRTFDSHLTELFEAVVSGDRKASYRPALDFLMELLAQTLVFGPRSERFLTLFDKLKFELSTIFPKSFLENKKNDKVVRSFYSFYDGCLRQARLEAKSQGLLRSRATVVKADSVDGKSRLLPGDKVLARKGRIGQRQVSEESMTSEGDSSLEARILRDAERSDSSSSDDSVVPFSERHAQLDRLVAEMGQTTGPVADPEEAGHTVSVSRGSRGRSGTFHASLAGLQALVEGHVKFVADQQAFFDRIRARAANSDEQAVDEELQAEELSAGEEAGLLAKINNIRSMVREAAKIGKDRDPEELAQMVREVNQEVAAEWARLAGREARREYRLPQETQDVSLIQQHNKKYNSPELREKRRQVHARRRGGKGPGSVAVKKASHHRGRMHSSVSVRRSNEPR